MSGCHSSLQQNVINAAIDEWRKQLEACMCANGQHFEHLLWARSGTEKLWTKSYTHLVYMWNDVIESHAHTVVWECCKDDQQSQWEMLKFDPQLPLNPLSDRHQIWRAWLRHGYLSPRKKWAQSVKGFLLPIYTKYTPSMFATLPYTHVYYFFLVLPIAYSRDPCMDFNA